MTILQQHSFVGSDGVRLIGDVGGPTGAPAVILLHGGGQTRHSWAGVQAQLIERGYFVVNYDARGHGESDWSASGDYSLDALSSDLLAVRGTIDGPVAFVGASMGGMTSFYTIGISSDPVADALVMVDIALRPAEEGADKIQKFMTANHDGFADLNEAADAVAAYNPDRPRPKDPSGLMRNLRLRDDGRLYWHWDPRMMQQTPRAEPPSFGNRMVAVSGHVTLPTLLVRGEKSDIVDDEGVEEMRRLVPQTEVYDVAGAGHMVAGDGVIGFLSRHLPVH